MELFIVSLAALVASGLTFLGSGSAPCSMPVFALFVPRNWPWP